MKRFFSTWLLATLCSPTHAGNDLADLSIDQLMNMDITTASKKEQKLSETPAAVFVLTRDDIQRSSATTLPELLLNVPGVEGGAINGHTEAVGIRGLGGQWSNKLVVLIDGRSIYTRMFSGVYWDAYNIPFEDIERIEVIRGANAALWGANAVNGVINIITRNSGNTQGTLLRGSAGTNSSGDLLARQGFQIGERGFARIYASGENHGDSAGHADYSANDRWSNQRAGFRADWNTPNGDRLMAEADIYHLSTDNNPLDPYRMPPDVVPIGLAVEPASGMHGHSLLASFTRAYALSSEWSLQMAWSYANRDEFLPIAEHNYDLDFQHRFQPHDNHDLVWGASVRYRKDDTTATPYLAFDPADASDTDSSLFVQDDIAIGKRLHLSLGSRFEHYHGDWEVQPSLRGLWDINTNHKLWAALSRAARTPSRVDRGIATEVPSLFSVPDYGVVPATLQLRGSKRFKTETMQSCELGYRLRPIEALSFDLALYYNHYDNLRTVDFGGYDLDSGILMTGLMGNSAQARVKGAELVANWSASERLRLQMFWGEQRIDASDATGWPTRYSFVDTFVGSSPERQVGLRADADVGSHWRFNTQLKYVSQLEHPYNPSLLKTSRVPSYVDLDAALGWRLIPQLELALLAKNIFDSSRLEYSSESGAKPTEVRRAAYIKATWSF